MADTSGGRTSRRVGRFLLAGLVVVIVLAGVVSSFASSSPDGLERVAIDQNFAHAANDHRLADGPMADYALSGLANHRLSTGAAGLIGAALTFAVTAVAVLVLRRVRRERTAERR